MSKIPDDIMEKARKIHEANSTKEWMKLAGQILTPVERIAYAVLEERKRCVRIAAFYESVDYDHATSGLGDKIIGNEDYPEFTEAVEAAFKNGYLL